MPRVRLDRELVINLTGYDREAAVYAAGEQDVPAVVAAFVARNPSVGEVLPEQPDAERVVAPEVTALQEAVPGLTEAAAAALVRSGFVTVEDLKRTPDTELAAIKGVGDKTIEAVRAAAPFQAPSDDEQPEDDAGGDEPEDAE